MAGQLYRALQRTDFLNNIAGLISDLRKKALAKQQSDEIFNRVSKYQTDVAGAQAAATTPGQPAQNFNVPYMLARPELQNAVDDPSKSVAAAVTGIPALNQPPENIPVTMPATAPQYDVRKHEQNLANLNVGLMKDMAGMDYLRPEDKNQVVNIADLLNRTYAPQRPVVTKLGDNESLVSYDPLNPNGIQTITSGRRKPFTVGGNAAFGYDDNGNVDFSKPLWQNDKHIGSYNANDGKVHDRWLKSDGTIYETISGSFYKQPHEPKLDPDRNRKIDAYASVVEGLNKLKQFDQKNLKEYTPDQIASILPKDFLLSKPPEGGYIISGKYIPKSVLASARNSERNKYVKEATKLVYSEGLMNVVDEIQNGLNLISEANAGKQPDSNDIETAITTVINQNGLKVKPETKKLLLNYFSLMWL